MARGLHGVGSYLNGSGGKRRHVLVAERALGKSLPFGVVVHHMDGNRGNNANGNLLVCPNEGYHNLIHIRTEALNTCGNANWRKCPFCGVWDSPDNLLTMNKHRTSPQSYHRQCRHDYYIRKKYGR